MKILSKYRDRLRQFSVPREFRIAHYEDDMGDLNAALATLVDLVEAIGKKGHGHGAGADSDTLHAIATAATGLWSCHRNLQDPSVHNSSGDVRRAFRHLESTMDKLRGAGLKVIDNKGEPYTPGMSVDVLVFQPEAGLDREMIIETVEPTVYLGEQRLQMGKVIVGKPLH